MYENATEPQHRARKQSCQQQQSLLLQAKRYDLSHCVCFTVLSLLRAGLCPDWLLMLSLSACAFTVCLCSQSGGDTGIPSCKISFGADGLPNLTLMCSQSGGDTGVPSCKISFGADGLPNVAVSIKYKSDSGAGSSAPSNAPVVAAARAAGNYISDCLLTAAH